MGSPCASVVLQPVESRNRPNSVGLSFQGSGSRSVLPNRRIAGRVEHGQHQNLSGFFAVIDAERETLDEGFTNVTVDNRVEVGLLGDSIKDSLNRSHKTRSESRLSPLVSVGSVIELDARDTPKDEGGAHVPNRARASDLICSHGTTSVGSAACADKRASSSFRRASLMNDGGASDAMLSQIAWTNSMRSSTLS